MCSFELISEVWLCFAASVPDFSEAHPPHLFHFVLHRVCVTKWFGLLGCKNNLVLLNVITKPLTSAIMGQRGNKQSAPVFTPSLLNVWAMWPACVASTSRRTLCQSVWRSLFQRYIKSKTQQSSKVAGCHSRSDRAASVSRMRQGRRGGNCN